MFVVAILRKRRMGFPERVTVLSIPFDMEWPTPQPVEDSAEEDGLRIVRSKRISLKPMDSEEAVLQMNMLGHDFFVYTDMDSNATSVVYRRKDGSYGLIETN